MATEVKPGQVRSTKQLLQQLCSSIIPTPDSEIQKKTLLRSYESLIFPYEILESESGESSSLAIDTYCFSLCCKGLQPQAAQLRALATNFEASSFVAIPSVSVKGNVLQLREHSAVIKMLLLLASEEPRSRYLPSRSLFDARY